VLRELGAGIIVGDIPPLAFAVGVYLPLSSTSPILIGGIIRWSVDKWIAKKHVGQNLTEEQLVAEGDKSPGVLMASGYIAGFMRASNAIYDIGEGRPIWKTLPVRVGLTLVLLVLTAISAIAVAVSGDVAKEVGDVIGVGSTAVDVWNVAKWPVLVLVVSFMFALLYWAAPNVRQPGFRWVSPGGLLAVGLWIVASLLFAFYVANFGSYNKTYGSLGGVIVFLIWLWISNIAVLLGAEFNAELERGRRIAGGQPAEREPYVEPRDTRKLDDDEQP